MNVSAFLDFVKGRIGGDLCGDEGVLAGPAEAEVTGVLVCFMATVEALEAARREGCSLVVTHETPFLPYEGLSRVPEDWREWSANRARLRRIEEGGLTVLRLHGTLDLWMVYDTFRELLGLPVGAKEEECYRVYRVEPAPVSAWIERAKKAVGMEHVRFLGDPDRVVSCIGLPWGGLGLFVNAAFVERVVKSGAELLIGGESDDYAMRYMADAGVAFIETSHSASENPGLAVFAGILRDEFPDLKVAYFECPVPCKWA